MNVRCKTFDAYIKELIFHPRKASKWMNDKRLTIQEKKILQGYLLIRSNQSSQVISDLKNSTESDIDFVKDHWNLILGICFNNIGNFQEAEKYLKLAINSFEANQNHYHLFTALFNYILLLSNSGRISEMTAVMNRMNEICPDYRLAKIRLLRCQFIYACDLNDVDSARDLIERINSLKANFSESDLAQHQICEFMFHIKQEDLDKAQNCLDEMKKFRNYSSSENFQFMRTLLDHLRKDSTIYVYERDFPTVPVLFWQLKVIECLQGLDRREADIYWSKLKQCSPDIYQDEFKYLGEKCLFSLCLDKHLRACASTFIVAVDSSHPQQLFQILQDAGSPVRKELLFELIYKEHPETKDDFIKLAKLISRVRNIYGVEIISRKGTYALETNETPKSKVTDKVSS